MFIEVEKITLFYNNELVLDNISFKLERGETLFIIGPNGGGKTSLVKILLGIIKPKSGKVLIDGKSPQHSRIKIGYLPQISSHESINDKIKIPVYEVIEQGFNQSTPKKEIDRSIYEIAKKLGIENILKKTFNSLSGGQKQRTLLARAMVNNPELLILDEPNTGLDYISQTSMFNIIESLKNKDTTMIIITHDISLIPGISTKVACLYKTIHIHDRPDSFLECPIITKSLDKGMEIILHGSGKPHRLLEKH